MKDISVSIFHEGEDIRSHIENYPLCEIEQWADLIKHAQKLERRCRLTQQGIHFSHDTHHGFYFPNNGTVPDHTDEDAYYADTLEDFTDIATSIIIGTYYNIASNKKFPIKLDSKKIKSVYQIGQVINAITSIVLRIGELSSGGKSLDRSSGIANNIEPSLAATTVMLEKGQEMLREQAPRILSEINVRDVVECIVENIAYLSETDTRMIEYLLQYPSPEAAAKSLPNSVRNDKKPR